MIGTDEIYRIACSAVDGEAVVDCQLVADEYGYLSQVAVTFGDGSSIIIMPHGAGYMFTSYTAAEYDEQPLVERFLGSGGDPSLENLSANITELW